MSEIKKENREILNPQPTKENPFEIDGYPYGWRLCRYCEHMKDLSDGQTGANAPGSNCELELVKPETGDLTAAICEKYGNWETVLARRKEQAAPQEISEEEHIEKAAAALETLKQVKGLKVQPGKPKPKRLDWPHKRSPDTFYSQYEKEFSGPGAQE